MPSKAGLCKSSIDFRLTSHWFPCVQSNRGVKDVIPIKYPGSVALTITCPPLWLESSPRPGDQFVFVEDCFGYVSAKEYVYGKRTCKPAEGFGLNAQIFCKKPIVVWAK